MTDYTTESPLILSFSPWEKGPLNRARRLRWRPLSHGERDRVRGVTVDPYAKAPAHPATLMAVIMLGEPCHGLFRRRNRWPGWNERALNHHDRQAKRARRFDLGDGGIAAGVFRQNNLDAVLAEQPDVVLRREGAARLNEDDVRQSERRGGQINQAYNVGVLRRGLQLGEGEAADPAENLPGLGANRLDSGGHIWRKRPIVAGPKLPGRSFDREQRRAGGRSRFDGMAAHLRGEGVRGIHQHLNALVPKIADEPFDAAKPAASRRDRLGARRGSPAGEGKRGIEMAVPGEQPCKRARFRGAPKEKYAHGSR